MQHPDPIKPGKTGDPRWHRSAFGALLESFRLCLDQTCKYKQCGSEPELSKRSRGYNGQREPGWDQEKRLRALQRTLLDYKSCESSKIQVFRLSEESHDFAEIRDWGLKTRHSIWTARLPPRVAIWGYWETALIAVLWGSIAVTHTVEDRITIPLRYTHWPRRVRKRYTDHIRLRILWSHEKLVWGQ